MGVLRHGAMSALFGGMRAPSTLGSHLRSCNWGNVSQLEKVNRKLLVRLARRAPLLPGAGELAFTGIDSTYEPPATPDLHLETVTMSPADAADAVVELLEREGFVPRT